MQISLSWADGLHILTRATLQQIARDKALLEFADGLIVRALKESKLDTQAERTLADTLQWVDMPQAGALLTALLVLDAEVNAVIEEQTRVWPLPAFLSYRSHLSPDKFPLNTLRLPPLNPDGHYRFATIGVDRFLAVRLDLHPHLKITGHVRVAISGPTRQPQRLNLIEHRLDRQSLDIVLIEAAVAASEAELSTVERMKLIELLRGVID